MVERFLADVHLGRLARLLRMLGFDTEYKNPVTTQELYSIAASEKRILLTRTGNMEARPLSFPYCTIHSEDPKQQLQEVIRQFNLADKARPFTRCMSCNGMLESVPIDGIRDSLREKTQAYYHEFWRCTQCSKVYWKGPHYNRMISMMHQSGIRFP